MTATPSSDAGASGFCGNPKLVGACADALKQALACFAPAGPCTLAAGASSTSETIDYDYCWANGAHYATSSDPSGQYAQFAWSTHGTPCLNGSSADQQYEYSAPSNVAYDLATGIVTCPDGTTLDVGDLSHCPEFSAVIKVDTSACINGGACP